MNCLNLKLEYFFTLNRLNRPFNSFKPMSDLIVNNYSRTRHYIVRLFFKIAKQGMALWEMQPHAENYVGGAQSKNTLYLLSGHHLLT